MGVVIDEWVFDKIVNYIEIVKKSDEVEIIVGGGYDKLEGYFIEFMVIVIGNLYFIIMEEEIFGLVLIIYVYEDEDFEVIFDFVDSIFFYVFIGVVFFNDCYVVYKVIECLCYLVGNFYINDKFIGVVVG